MDLDPHERPDIYGKVGNAGVSICTLDDMKALYDGFDLCDPYDLGIHDYQWSGANYFGDVFKYCHRSAG